MVKTWLSRAISTFALALIVAATWTYLARHMYHYNIDFPVIFGLNLFPLTCWTVSLTAGCLSANYLLRTFRIKHRALQLISVIGYYALWLIFVETVGYHVFGVRDVMTGDYPGLPICDCLHAPVWMQFAYFTLGPLHWVVAQALPWTRQK